MTRLKGKNTSTILIVLLVVLNLALLGTLWYKFIHTSRTQDGPPRIGNRSPGIPDPGDRARFEAGLKRFLKKELNFSTEQQGQFIRLQREHLKNIRETDQRISQLRQELIETLFEEKVDADYVDRLSNEIGTTTAAHEKSLLTHFRALSEICKPEQEEKYKKLLHQILEKLKPRSRAGKRPPEGQRPSQHGNGPPMNGHLHPPR